MHACCLCLAARSQSNSATFCGHGKCDSRVEELPLRVDSMSKHTGAVYHHIRHSRRVGRSVKIGMCVCIVSICESRKIKNPWAGLLLLRQIFFCKRTCFLPSFRRKKCEKKPCVHTGTDRRRCGDDADAETWRHAHCYCCCCTYHISPKFEHHCCATHWLLFYFFILL